MSSNSTRAWSAICNQMMRTNRSAEACTSAGFALGLELWAPPRLRAGFALGDLPASCVCPGSCVLLMRHTLRVPRGFVLLARIGLRVLGSLFRLSQGAQLWATSPIASRSFEGERVGANCRDSVFEAEPAYAKAHCRLQNAPSLRALFVCARRVHRAGSKRRCVASLVASLTCVPSSDSFSSCARLQSTALVAWRVELQSSGW